MSPNEAIVFYARGGWRRKGGGHNLKLGDEAVEGGVIISS